MQLTGKGKDKDKDLNLVPYIDLLTCMIAFLLITAVWTQLARLQVSQVGPGSGEEEDLHRTPVLVLVGEQGLNLVVHGERQLFPRAGSDHDFPALRRALDALKGSMPDREDLLVSAEDGITYDTIVRTMDTVLAAGFPALSLVDAGRAGL